MPFLDKRTGHVVIRVVYDGAPEAGKTTNIVELSKGMAMQRRSDVVSPRTTQRRTEFFDWMTFTGGYVDGRRLRCQLVSVPGQPALLRRRSYLLDTADAVVFVADSRPIHLEENRRSFELMRRAIERRGGEVPARVLLQANKQDLTDSLDPDALALALEVSSGTPVFGARALTGEGVMQTFIAAVRLGTDRVKHLMAGQSWEGLGAQERSPEELLAALDSIEAELASSEPTTGLEGSSLGAESEPNAAPVEGARNSEAGVDPLARTPRVETREAPTDGPGAQEGSDAPRSVDAAVPRAAADLRAGEGGADSDAMERDEAGTTSDAFGDAPVAPSALAGSEAAADPIAVTDAVASVAPDSTSDAGGSPSAIADDGSSADAVADGSSLGPGPSPIALPVTLSLPSSEAVAHGHVWPLVEGRVVFAEMSGGESHLVDESFPWASRRLLEARVDDGRSVRWALHTCDDWGFGDSVEDARREFIGMVRRLSLAQPRVPPGRALSLHHDGVELRVWMVTEVMPTLREVLRECAAGDRPRAHARSAVLDASRVANELATVRLDVEPLDALGIEEGRVWVLAFPSDANGEWGMTDLPDALESEIELLPGLGMSSHEAGAALEGEALPPRLREALLRWWTRGRS